MEPSKSSVALLTLHSLFSWGTFLPLRSLGAHFAPDSRGACQSNGASFPLKTKTGEEFAAGIHLNLIDVLSGH